MASINWLSKYVYDDEIIRYISLETRKTNDASKLSNKSFQTILIHTSVPFGLKYQGITLTNEVKMEIKQLIVSSLLKQLPCLQDHSPLDVHLVNWEYSQVSSTPFSLEDDKSIVIQPLVSSDNMPGPIVAIASEMFTESNFEGCLRSGENAVDKVMSILSTNKDI